MVARLCVVGLFLVACGGNDGALFQDLDGASGSASQAGTAQSSAGAAQAGSAGEPDSAAGDEAAVSQGGSQEPAAGTGGVGGGGSAGESSKVGSGGGPQGGAAAGGASGSGGAAAGQGGKATGGAAGAGGMASDPLEPKPVDGCSGYVKVLVPKGTCIWFHGTHSIQTESCSLTDPPEGKCSTASAVAKDLTSIVSDNAEMDRFDLEVGSCPKTCP